MVASTRLWAACVAPPTGLVDWWPGEGSAAELVGTNNAVLLNGTTFTTGEVGQAFHFDGTNNLIQIGAAAIQAPWTAEFWINRQPASGTSAVLLSDPVSALKLEQFQTTQKVGFTVYHVQDYSFNYTAPVGTWVHLVFVGTTTNTQLYTNGVFNSSTNVSTSLPRMFMGTRNLTNSFANMLKGSVDEVSLYNRVLSPSEIQSLYNAGTAGKCTSGPPPPNDNFSNATPILGTSTTVTGSNVNATKETGEYWHAGNPGGASVWWSWTAQFNGRVTLDTSSSSFTTLVGVYEGSSVDSLFEDADNQFSSTVVFQAIAGTTYYIAVDGYNDGTSPQEGNISMSLSECIKPKVLLPFPSSMTQSTEADGIHVTICASVQGSVTSYEWTLDSNPTTNTPGPCVEFVFDPTDDGSHTINFIARNSCGFDGQNGGVTTCGICLSLGTPTVLTGTTGSGFGPQLATSCGDLSSNTRWYKLVATNGTGAVTLSTEGSSMRTLVGVYKGSLTAPVPVACTGSLSPTVQQSRLTFHATQGTVYWIAIDPGTTSISTLRLATGFEPHIASYGLNPDGSFRLQSSIAAPIPYTLLSTTNPGLNITNWSVALSTNLTTGFPYLVYRETNARGGTRRFYRISP